MNSSLRAWIARDRPELVERVRAAARTVGITVEREIDLSAPSALENLAGCPLLFCEQRDALPVVEARVSSLAGANRDLLLVAVVPSPRQGMEAPLLRAGAFDVVEDSHELAAQLTHTAAAARRVFSLQAQRSSLFTDLAHQEKLSALGVLAAGVGHEINNPCCVVLNNMKAMREELEAAMLRPPFEHGAAFDRSVTEWLEMVGDCIHAADTISSIVRTLRVFSRNADLEPVLTDVNDEIRTVLRLIGKEVRFSARFDLQLDPALPRVLAPPNAVAQVVTNLVVNALHALESAPNREPTLGVTTSFDDEFLMIEVVDNGPGIAPEHLHRIFDPFFTTKPVGKGTGLGLSITRSLVERMGGEIVAASRPGEGARFSVMIARPSLANRTRGASESEPPPTQRLRVLVIDDEEFVLRALRRGLSSQFECVCFSDARAAVEALGRDAAFDAVITDVVMPELSGLDVFEALERVAPSLCARTVFVSGGVASESLRQRISSTGCQLIPKTDVQQLIQVIREVGRT